MRYDRDRKQESQKRVLESASHLFREHGFDGVGVQGLMAGAGLTHGAFYNHFASKSELAAQAMLDVGRERLRRLQAQIDSGRGLVGHIDSYLSLNHRDHQGSGCPTAALAADIARQSDAVRDAYSQSLGNFIDLLATQWPDLDATAARARAISLHALLAGALQMARATSDERFSDAILVSARAQALSLVEGCLI
jgi:TetR/AcrR family transcriptional repressor of nem operon